MIRPTTLHEARCAAVAGGSAQPFGEVQLNQGAAALVDDSDRGEETRVGVAVIVTSAPRGRGRRNFCIAVSGTPRKVESVLAD